MRQSLDVPLCILMRGREESLQLIMIKIFKHNVWLCILTTSIFSFGHNMDVHAQDKPVCNSLLNAYPCDAASILKNSNMSYINGSDIRSKDVVSMMQSSDMVIKLTEGKGKKNVSKSEVLKFNKSEQVTSEVIAQEKVKTVFNKVSVTGDGKAGSSRSGNVSHSVFGVKQGGFLFVEDSKVNVTNTHGIAVESSTPIFKEQSLDLQDDSLSWVVFEKSNIMLKGRGARGLYFRGDSLQDNYQEGELLVNLGTFHFKNTAFRIPDGTAIYSDDARRYPYITASEGTRIFADTLLDVKNNSYVGIEADASFLAGGAHVEKDSYASVELFNKSQWTVRASKNAFEKSKGQDSYFVDSSISFVRLIDSSIFFHKSQNGHSQRLQVGVLDDSATDYAYVAGGDARLYVNAYRTADKRGNLLNADQLLIRGNVYGSTKVYVRGVASNPETKENFSKNNNVDSISVVQVYGKAKQDSFKLPVGYVALGGAPYRYRLCAYSSVLNNANDTKGLAKDDGEFWDYRLEREYINSSKQLRSKVKKVVSRLRKARSIGDVTGHNGVVSNHDGFIFDEIKVQALVPQVPTYLLLPNALFHAGLMDISNQNKQLRMLRVTSRDLLENGKSPAFFIRSYGGNHHYASNLSTLEYGYGGNLDYNAVGVGVVLKARESTYSSASFGLMGTYGKMALLPKDVAQSQKSSLNKWSVTAYGSMQYDMGFYGDGFFSYGSFKGDVLTLARGRTATLEGNLLNASLTFGKSIMAGYQGFIFDPHVQVVYQNLHFGRTPDIDGFDIEMGKPDQWLMRIGGGLTKTLFSSKEAGVVSFSGKLHLAHGFGGKKFVHFADSFELGSFGSALEAGLGFNAQLSSQFAVHGDMTYQRRLGKAGFSGVSFSGGVRYRF